MSSQLYKKYDQDGGLPAPASVDAEQAFLGAILLDPDLLDTPTAERLTPDRFFIVRNGWVWDAITRLRNRNDAVDYITVCEELRAQGRLDEVGGPAYITFLINETPATLYGEAYGELVNRAAWRRDALNGASEIARLAHAPDNNVFEVMQRIDDLTESLRGDLPRAEQVLRGKQALEHYAALMQTREDATAPASVALPWSGFSRYLAAVPSGKVVVVSGFSGEGKTIMMEGIADWIAAMDQKVFYITTELSRDDLLDRMAARHTGAAYGDLIDPKGGSGQTLAVLRDKVGRWIQFMDWWEIGADVNARAVLGRMQQERRRGVRYFFIDYIWEIPVDTSRTKGDQKAAYDNFIRALHTFAKDTGSTVYIASQLSDTDHGPRTYGTRVLQHKCALHIRLETIKAEESRVYLLDTRLVPSKAGEPSPIVLAHIDKNTYGPRGTVPLFKDGARFRFMDEHEVKYSVAYCDERLEQAEVEVRNEPLPF